MPENASEQAPQLESTWSCVLSLRLSPCTTDSKKCLPAASEQASSESLLSKPMVMTPEKFSHKGAEGNAVQPQQAAELFLHLSTLYKDYKKLHFGPEVH